MNPVNTPYNKAIYSTLIGSFIAIVSLVLNQFFHITLGDPLVAAVNTFCLALVTFLIPNASSNGG